MRAFHVPGPGKSLVAADYDVPAPGPGQVRVAVQACGVCHSDSFTLSGLPGMTFPLIPGHEIAGVVDEAGPGVAGWAPGDRVGVGWFGGQCGRCRSCRKGRFVTCPGIKAPGLQVNGGYAEYVVVPVTALARVPDGLEPAHAAPLMCAGVTALNALRRTGAGPGSRVTVAGIGGVGHLAVQFAAAMGCEVIAASHGRAKEAHALKLGAHHFADITDPGCGGMIAALGGTDILLVTSPSGDDVTRLLPAVAAEGRIVVTGFTAEPIQVSSVDLISRNLTLLGSAAGTSMDAEETLCFSALHGILPVIEEFPLAAARDAYQAMTSGATFRAVITIEERPTGAVLRQAAVPSSGSQAAAPALIASRPGGALDCPPDQVPEIDELIQAAMQWHFSKETGSPFWLERARRLDFDPRTDVRTLADLRLFPNFVNDLRAVPVRDLIPRGYGDQPQLVGVFESGGVTGHPKRLVLLRDWLDRWLAWYRRIAEERRYPVPPRHLMVAPSGPHLMTYQLSEGVRSQHGTVYAIDLDPRWVRKCINEGRSEEVERYSEHLIDQVASLLRTQDINMLTITPPLLERLARQPELVSLVQEKIAVIAWGGTHMDADTLDIYRTDLFPGILLQGGYGSTMVLAGSLQRVAPDGDGTCVFDPFWPYVTFSVIDPATGAQVPYGERGQVIMNHVSKSMLVPNNLERDTAIRLPALPGEPGDSVADVLPVASFEGTAVIEGVY